MSVSLVNYPDLLTPDDVHKLTRLNVQHIRRLLVSGQLPGVKIGARWYVPRSELEKFISTKMKVKNANG